MRQLYMHGIEDWIDMTPGTAVDGVFWRGRSDYCRGVMLVVEVDDCASATTARMEITQAFIVKRQAFRRES